MPNILFVYLALVQACLGHYWFRDRIPNGHNVLNPHADPNDPDSTIWRGVGHLAREGGGPRNVFGLDFKANNFVSKVVFLFSIVFSLFLVVCFNNSVSQVLLSFHSKIQILEWSLPHLRLKFHSLLCYGLSDEVRNMNSQAQKQGSIHTAQIVLLNKQTKKFSIIFCTSKLFAHWCFF